MEIIDKARLTVVLLMVTIIIIQSIKLNKWRFE